LITPEFGGRGGVTFQLAPPSVLLYSPADVTTYSVLGVFADAAMAVAHMFAGFIPAIDAAVNTI